MKYNDYQYILAYALIIAILAFITRSRIGYVTTYYLLALFCFVLLLLRASWFVDALKPITNP